MMHETLYCLQKGCRFADTKRVFTGSRFLINHYRQSHNDVEAGRRAVEKQRRDAIRQAAEEDSPQGVPDVIPDSIGDMVSTLQPKSVVDYLDRRIDELTQQSEAIQERLTKAEAELVFATDELNRCKAARDAYNSTSGPLSHHKQE